MTPKARTESAAVTPQGEPLSKLEWIGGTLLTPEGADPDADDSQELVRDVQWYTGAAIPRMDYWTGEKYMLTLSMEPGACDLSRLNNGAPMLDTHQSYDLSSVIGVVVDGSARIENGVGMAKVRFSQRPELAGLRADVRAGIVRNISVGTSIGKLKDTTPEDSKIKSYLATSWQPAELSAVPIGADAGAGFLSHQVIEPDREVRAAAQQETTVDPQQTTGVEEQARAIETARLEAVTAERARVSAIETACAPFTAIPAEFKAALISTGAGIDEARAQIIAKLAEITQSDPTRSNGTHAHVSRDARDTLALSAENALLHRIDPRTTLDAGRQFAHMSLLEMGRAYLEASTGKQIRGMSKSELAGLLLRPSMGSDFQTFAPGYMGTTDYPSVLANVFNKTLRRAYDAEPQTFRSLGTRGTAPDFKQMNRIQIGDMDTMSQIGPNGEFSYAKMGDAKEVYSLATYGKIYAVNRQTLINDDLGAFNRIPMSMGRSASRLESDVWWNIILANAAMGDTVALFDATTHKNYTSSGTAVSIASLGVGRQLMRKQTGLNGVGYLNLTPKYFVVPPEIETVAQQYTVQTNIVVTQQSNVNPIGPTLTVIPEPRLSGGIGSQSGSTTAWYLFADPGMIDTIEYSYLEGQEGVYLETRMGFDVDGMELKGRLDFAAKALDWRGMYKNAGA